MQWILTRLTLNRKKSTHRHGPGLPGSDVNLDTHLFGCQKTGWAKRFSPPIMQTIATRLEMKCANRDGYLLSRRLCNLQTRLTTLMKWSLRRRRRESTFQSHPIYVLHSS